MGISVTRRTYRAVAKAGRGRGRSVKSEDTFFLDLLVALVVAVRAGYRLVKSR